MTAKEYLSQVRNLRKRIKHNEELIMEIDDMMTSIGAIRYDKDMIQSSPRNDQIDNALIKKEALETQIWKDISEYMSLSVLIENQIANMKPEIYSDVLRMRYVKGLSLKRISKELVYSYSRIRTVHGYALREFAQKYLKDDTQ